METEIIYAYVKPLYFAGRLISLMRQSAKLNILAVIHYYWKFLESAKLNGSKIKKNEIKQQRNITVLQYFISTRPNTALQPL